MMNRKYFFATFFLLIYSSIFAQVKVTVFKINGTQQEFSISEQGSLSFDENNLVIFGGGIVYSPINIPRSEIHKLTFTELASNAVETPRTTSLQIYPNPALSQFAVTGVDGESFDYIIFSLDGRKAGSGRAENSTPIDISQLNSGVYLVKIENYLLKLIKI